MQSTSAAWSSAVYEMSCTCPGFCGVSHSFLDVCVPVLLGGVTGSGETATGMVVRCCILPEPAVSRAEEYSRRSGESKAPRRDVERDEPLVGDGEREVSGAACCRSLARSRCSSAARSPLLRLGVAPAVSWLLSGPSAVRLLLLSGASIFGCY